VCDPVAGVQARAPLRPDIQRHIDWLSDEIARTEDALRGMVSAIRFNPTIRDFYQRKRKEGKLKMVAFVAAMRKLLITLNAMLRDKSTWHEASQIP
jgi:hypothetical protein